MNHVQFKSVWENWGFTDSNFRYGLNQVPKHCQQMYISQLYFLFSGFSLTRARWPLELSIFWFSNSSQKRALLFLTERQHSKTTLIALTSVMPPPWIGSSGHRTRTFVYPGTGEGDGMSPQCGKPHWRTVRGGGFSQKYLVVPIKRISENRTGKKNRW